MESSPTKSIHPYLPASKAQYWSWGLPSLVLAIVTVVIAAVSQWVVEPQIPSKYEKILGSAIEELDRNSAQELSSEDAGRWSLTEKQFKEATLAAKRLIATAPQDPTPKWQLARLEWAAAEKYQSIARTEKEKLPASERDALLERSRASMTRAWNELRDASRLEGVDAQRALFWIIQRTIDSQSQALPGKINLEELLTQITDSPASPELAADRNRLMGRIQLLRALDVFSTQSSDSINDLIQQSSQFLGQASRPKSQGGEPPGGAVESIEELWLAECSSWSNQTSSQATARRFITTWVPRISSSASSSSELIEAVCRAFGLLDNPQEASAFLATRLPSLDPGEQIELRMRLGAFVLRRLVPLAHGRNHPSKVTASQWLIAVLQIAPDSPRVQSLVRELVARNRDLPVVARILEEDLPGTERKPIFVMLQLLSNEQEDSVTPEQLLSLGSAGLLSAFGAVTLQNCRDGLMDQETAQRRLTLIAEQIPNAPDVWMTKAMIALQSRELSVALEALHRLKQLTPGNERVEQLLNEIQEQSSSQISPP